MILISAIWFDRNTKSLYGTFTKRVDYKQFQPQTSPVAINNVNILSPDGDSIIPNRTVYIENGLIISVDTLPRESGEIQIIDGQGKFLIPGLTDSHVHLFKSSNDLLLYIANGVTQIREMIGNKDILEWRKQLKNGRIGPDMFIASPRLGSFGLIEGWFMTFTQGFTNVRNTKEAEKIVQKFSKQGYDAVKIYSHLNKESYEAVNKTAESFGLKVVGHIPWSIEFSDIWKSNQCEIAHLEEIMNAFRREFNYPREKNAEEFLEYAEKRSREIAKELITNNIVVTTTLWLTESFARQKFELDSVLKEVELEYENPAISEWNPMVPQGLGWLPDVNRYRLPDDLTEEDIAWQRVFWDTYAKACQVIVHVLANEGVKIMAGTDANLPPTVPGFSLHDELVSLNKAGMTTAHVLQSATSIPADWLNNNAGRILPGRKANLVLLEKNPLENIHNTKTINTVFLNGQVFNRSLLNQILVAVKEANDASRKKDISQYTNQ